MKAHSSTANSGPLVAISAAPKYASDSFKKKKVKGPGKKSYTYFLLQGNLILLVVERKKKAESLPDLLSKFAWLHNLDLI